MFNKKFIISLGMSFLYLSTNALPSAPEFSKDNFDNASRKIGIFSGGLLATHPGILKINKPFEKSTLTLPIRLGRIFGKETTQQRLTRIYDKNFGTPIHVWHTTSTLTSLPQALQNMADRKRTKIDNIFYIKTLLPHNKPNKFEEPIVDMHGQPIHDKEGNPWYIYEKKHNSMSIQDKVALADWASDQDYTAVLWTGFGKNPGYDHEQLKSLLKDKTTLENTKKYIRHLPDPEELTPFEKNIATNQL